MSTESPWKLRRSFVMKNSNAFFSGIGLAWVSCLAESRGPESHGVLVRWTRAQTSRVLRGGSGAGLV